MIADEPPWKLVYYIMQSGRCPVHEFFQELRRVNPKAYIAFMDLHKRTLERFGPSIGKPLWDGLGNGLGEIRWKGPQKGNFRVYCSVESHREIVMYEGAKKTWPDFRPSDRRLCEQRRADFLSASYDQEQRQYLAQAHYNKKSQ